MNEADRRSPQGRGGPSAENEESSHLSPASGGVPASALQDFLRQGIAAHQSGRLAEAMRIYQQILDTDPDHPDANHLLGVLAGQSGGPEIAARLIARAIRGNAGVAAYHGNLGYALHALGRLDEAEASFREALRLDARYPEAHMNLGNTLLRKGRVDDAITSYLTALELDPDYIEARSNVGTLLQDIGRFEEAIPHFERLDDKNAKARLLECYYGAGRFAEYNEYLYEFCRNDPLNRRVAAISAFAAQQWDAEDPYPFCKQPLDFIYIANIGSDLASDGGFFARIIEEIDAAPTSWEPPDNAARGGYHSIGNLFDIDTPAISALRDVIRARAEDYRARYGARDDGLIRHWPRRFKLYGWHVRLLQGGHMEPHYHPSGWLSGVIYLKMPAAIAGDEGAITFTLHGHNYPVRTDNIPTLRHAPKEGDLVLFPSSLFHFTTPFRSDDERRCISFDLNP